MHACVADVIASAQGAHLMTGGRGCAHHLPAKRAGRPRDENCRGSSAGTQFGGRFCRNASIPSRASSETNSRADCSVNSSAWRSNPSRIGAVVSAFDAARPCGDALPDVGGQGSHLGLDIVGGNADQPDTRRLGRPELLPGEEVAPGRAGGHLRQQRQRDDRRRDTDAGLGQRERAGRPGHRRCRRRRSGPILPRARDRRPPRSPASAARASRVAAAVSSRAPVDGDVAGITAGGFGRSAPAQKVPPVCPSTTARTPDSSAASLRPWCNWWTSAVDSALRLSGESSVSRATLPSTR